MSQEDKISFEVKEDGTVVANVDGEISGPNHMVADAALAMLGKMLGGEVTIKQNANHTHTHVHAEQGVSSTVTHKH